MKIQTLCLALAVTLWCTMVPPAYADALKEEKIHQMRVGDADVWIISTVWRDHPTSVLLPKTEAHKQAIANAYPTGNMRNSLNVLLVRGKTYTALVDTGLPTATPHLIDGLAAAGITPKDITHVIITHAHGDHVGGLTVNGEALFPQAKILMSATEYDFWFNPANIAKAPERAKGIFEQLPTILAPYKDRIEKIDGEKEVLPHITMIEAFGHTPGHVMVLVKGNAEDTLLFWADLMHGMRVQMDYPDIATTYDVDPEMSIVARKAILTRAAKENWRVSGVHVPGVAPWNMPKK